MQLSSLAFCNDPGLASFAIGKDLQGKIITKGMSVGLLLILPVSEKSDSFHSFTFFKKGILVLFWSGRKEFKASLIRCMPKSLHHFYPRG